MDRCGGFLPRTDACVRGYAASFYAGGITYLGNSLFVNTFSVPEYNAAIDA